jgi:hypothetical protein
MALSESVLSELLDSFRAGEGVDLVRDAVRLVLQDLIEVEAAEQIGAGRYERSESRITERSRVRFGAHSAGAARDGREPGRARRPRRPLRRNAHNLTYVGSGAAHGHRGSAVRVARAESASSSRRNTVHSSSPTAPSER